MMGYRVKRPLFLDVERLPSVQIGDPYTGGVVSCDVSFVGREHTLWRLRITVQGRLIYDDSGAIRRPVLDCSRSRQATQVLASAMSFLLADAEAYRATMGRQAPPDGWLFNAIVAEWAYLHDAELQIMADLLAEVR